MNASVRKAFKRATEVTCRGYIYGTMVALKCMLSAAGRPWCNGAGWVHHILPGHPAAGSYFGAKFAMRSLTDSVRTEVMHQEGSHLHVTMPQLPGQSFNAIQKHSYSAVVLTSRHSRSS